MSSKSDPVQSIESIEVPRSQAPNVADQTVIAVLQSELNQANGNRIWLLARNAELEDELRATRAELESMRLASVPVEDETAPKKK